MVSSHTYSHEMKSILNQKSVWKNGPSILSSTSSSESPPPSLQMPMRSSLNTRKNIKRQIVVMPPTKRQQSIEKRIINRISSSSKAKPTTTHSKSTSVSSTAALDVIGRLNNMAVSCLESNNRNEAKWCFQEALSRVNGMVISLKKKSASLGSVISPIGSQVESGSFGESKPEGEDFGSIYNVGNKDENNTGKKEGRSKKRAMVAMMSNDKKKRRTSSSSVSSWLSSHQSGVQKPQGDYDEGMDTFMNPLRIECLEYDTVVSTVLFNLGLLICTDDQDKEEKRQQRRQKNGPDDEKEYEDVDEDVDEEDDDDENDEDEEEEAVEYFYRALAVAQRASPSKNLGHFHLEERRVNTSKLLIRVLHNIGHVRYRSGRYDEAMESYDEALRVGRLCLASKLPLPTSFQLDVASTLNCLGVVHFHMLARKGNTKSHNDKDKTGPNTKGSNDGSKAVSYLVESLTIRRAILGNTHMDVATTLNNIGRLHYVKHEYIQAVEMYRESLRVRKLILGLNHIDLMASFHNLGQAYHRLTCYDDALECYDQFLRIVRHTATQQHHQHSLPTNHQHLAQLLPSRQSLDVSNVLKCIGQIYHRRGDRPSALNAYLQALAARTGSSLASVELHTHEVTSHIQDDFDLDKYYNAKQEPHPDIASILNKIGNIHYEMGHYDLAVQSYQRGLGIERLVLSSNHPNIIVTLTNIGQIYKMQKLYHLALPLYNEAYEIQRSNMLLSATNTSTTNPIINSTNTRCHPEEVARTLCNVGYMHGQLNQHEKSLLSYREVLRLRRSIHGDIHLDVASTLNALGLLLFKKGLYDVAVESFVECCRIRRVLLGGMHRDVAIALYNIATALLERNTENDEDVALKLYYETLRVERKSLGECHKDVASTLHHIAQIHERRGDLSNALECYYQALEVERDQLLSPNVHEQQPHDDLDQDDIPTLIDIAKTLNRIGNLHVQRGHGTKAVSVFTEAARIHRNILSSTTPSERSQYEGLSSLPPPTSSPVDYAGFQFYNVSILHPECAPVA